MVRMRVIARGRKIEEDRVGIRARVRQDRIRRGEEGLVYVRHGQSHDRLEKNHDRYHSGHT